MVFNIYYILFQCVFTLQIILIYSLVPFTYIYSSSNFYEILVFIATETWWTNLHCFQPKTSRLRPRKHTRFKYIRRRHQRGLRLLTLIAIVAGTRSKPSHCVYNAIAMPTYHVYNAATTYSISAHDSGTKVGALVDRGANGGIAITKSPIYPS